MSARKQVVQMDNWKVVKDRKGGVCLVGRVGKGHKDPDLKAGTRICSSPIRRFWGKKYAHTQNTHYRLGKPARSAVDCRC